jgi:hypothetical protein
MGKHRTKTCKPPCCPSPYPNENYFLDLPCCGEGALAKAGRYVDIIWGLYTKAKKLDDFIPGGGTMKNAAFVARLFHDEFFLSARKHGLKGSLYRSEAIVCSSLHRIGNTKTDEWPHCEHAVPITLMMKYLYNCITICSKKQLGEFLADNIYVVAIACDKDVASLNAGRNINGVTKSWRSDHPELDASCQSPTAFCDVKPFLRYSGTKINIYSMLRNCWIDVDRFKVSDHHNDLKNNSHFLCLRRELLNLL